MKKPIDFPEGFHNLTRTNLNHLVYFWAVARTGSITGGAKMLRISQSTVSEQLKALESRLGATLVDRGRGGASLTPAGQRVFRFADEAVGVCSQLLASLPLDEEPPMLPALRVGTADAMPKLVVRSLLQPLLESFPALTLECREWRIDHLLAELSLHRLDLVLTDAPVEAEGSPTLNILPAGDSPLVLLAHPSLARRLREDFPKSLSDAPLLLPAHAAPMRQRVERWLAQRSLTPRIVVTAEDRAILHHFAQIGTGAVPAPEMIAKELCTQFGLARVGELHGCRDEFYVVVMQRADAHPALASLVERIQRPTKR